MSLAPVQSVDTSRPVILFIDDEQRVLKSMRAMFRRDYDVYLANSGEEALSIIDEHEIDVVVSDQRMPYMTGVEVLTEIKQRAPNTVRILLTGYADLSAVEASINDAEVFKYLMKPCPAKEIRGALQAGLEMRDSGQLLGGVVSEAVEPKARDSKGEQGSNVARLDSRRKESAPKAKRRQPQSMPEVELSNAVQVMVFSSDSSLCEGVTEACPTFKVHSANSLDEALKMLGKHPIGVLVTDVGVDEKEVAKLSRAVRSVTPEIVIVLASERSDASMLIELINSGQVFRFLLKPLQTAQCKIWLTSAVRRFIASGGQALAALDEVVNKPSTWSRFKNWLLGA